MSSDLINIPDFVSEVLMAAGVRFDELLSRAGIAALPFHGDRLRVNTNQFFAFWNAVEAFGVPADFALRLVAAPAKHQFDIASVAALHSENFAEALSTLARYKRLTCPEDIKFDLDGEELQIRFIWMCATSNAPSLLIDGAFAWLLQLMQTGSGQPIKPLRVELTRPQANENMLRQYFNCPISFHAPADRLVFPRQVLKIPFSTYNPEMLEIMTPGLEAALQARTVSLSLPDHVRASLLKNMRGKRPSVEQVAKELCVSPRTLQRRLEEAGTSYQLLLNEVRQQTAQRLLSDTDLEAGEIAFVLGFEELNSFTRAFRGWEGTSPNRWRSMRGHTNARRTLQ